MPTIRQLWFGLLKVSFISRDVKLLWFDSTYYVGYFKIINLKDINMSIRTVHYEDNDDVVDTITLMEYEQGNMNEEEQIRMCSTILKTNQIEQLPVRYTRLAHSYIKAGVLDEEGDINFIKLKEYL